MSEADLAAQLRLSVSRIARWLAQHDPGLLTMTQTSVVALVEAKGPLRIGDLADMERVAAPTMTRMVASLEDGGYLTREPDPTDARVSLVRITPKGHRHIDTARHERTTALSKRLSTLSEEQRAALIAALPALDAILEESQ